MVQRTLEYLKPNNMSASEDFFDKELAHVMGAQIVAIQYI